MLVRRLATGLIALVSALTIVSAALAQDMKPAGQVEITKTEIGFLVNVGGGRGRLHFDGHTYHFRIGGLGVGGMGISETHATGDVYNLKYASDFAGVYGAVRSGFAVGKMGKGAMAMENEKGVVIHLRGTAEGVRFNLGADGVKISME